MAASSTSGMTGLARAVDSHAHVFDLARFPFHPSSGFSLLANEPGTARQYAAVLDSHGFSHALLINPLGGYGVDNRNMMQILAESAGRFKGVAVVPHDIAEAELDALVAGGVVGIRFNLSFPASPSLFGAGGQRLLALARERGLFAQVHYHEEAHILEAVPVLRRAGLPLVFDHCGRPHLERGLAQPGFQALLELGREGAHVKLSAPFRYSKAGWPYEDVDDYVRALVDACTLERCVWGSDWPFLRAGTRVDYGPELHPVSRWFPDPADRRRLLWDNPSRLFGFR
ncbi:amidohydrolase family protein [Verticiella sediminum]|uniref:Amidohydrolase family protein n=1 Tax=Verticiella sediminum TaxID=1247510 RepID=A0A556ALP8_9BURK|nr:amidohydrolase family protein [Verticiella sediminum]TSH93820.1 amidohydrolase family protein [Verticiella sediminum]